MRFLKNSKLILKLAVLILLTALTFEVYQLTKPEEKEIDTTETTNITKPEDEETDTTETINIRVIISLDNGEKVISDKELEVPLNSTIYDVLRNHFDVKVTEYSFGIFITSINGYEQNGNKYWFFSVNGEYIMVGVDAYYLKDNDIVVGDLHGW